MAITIGGMLPALLTPMNEDGSRLNTGVLHDLVGFYLQQGVDGFFVCGGTGEGLLLTVEERQEVLETVMQAVDRRARVIVHVGALATPVAEGLAAHAASLGVDAVAAVPPFYYRVDDAALFEHYRLIADAAAGTAVWIYNMPQATGVTITAATMTRLLEIPAVAGIKYSSYDLYDMRNMLELAPGRLTVLSGFDEVCVAAAAMGAHGAIGGTLNVLPATFCAISHAFHAGDLATAQELQYRANRVIRVLLSVPMLAALKAIVTSWDYACGSPRRPLRPLGHEEHQRLFSALDAAGFAELEAEARQYMVATA